MDIDFAVDLGMQGWCIEELVEGGYTLAEAVECRERVADTAEYLDGMIPEEVDMPKPVERVQDIVSTEESQLLARMEQERYRTVAVQVG